MGFAQALGTLLLVIAGGSQLAALKLQDKRIPHTAQRPLPISAGFRFCISRRVHETISLDMHEKSN
jgi:hypothetical protein